MIDKTKFMEAYEKFHEKLLELRHLKSQITLAEAEVKTAEQRSREYIEEANAQARSIIESAKREAEALTERAAKEADKMRSEPAKNVGILRGRIKSTASFLRKQEDKLRELQQQELNEVNEARTLYMPKSKMQKMYEAGAEAARETMLASAVEDEQHIESEHGGPPTLLDEPDPNNVAHAPGQE